MGRFGEAATCPLRGLFLCLVATNLYRVVIYAEHTYNILYGQSMF